MNTFSCILRGTARLITRHWVLSISTLLATAAMMLVLGVTALFSLNTQNLLKFLESDLVVHAYVRMGGNVNVVQLADTVRALESVESLTAVTPQEAWAKLERTDLPLEIYETHFPWSFEIRVKRASEVSRLVNLLISMPDIEDVVYSGLVVERVAVISGMAFRAAVAAFILSIMIMSLIIHNAVHTSLYSSREEIAIMFPDGATRGYISNPFVLYGTFLAFTGALVAVSGIASTYLHVIRNLQINLPFLMGLAPDTRAIGCTGMLLAGFGAALGCVFSFITVRCFRSRV